MLVCIPTLTSCGGDFVFAERDGGSYYSLVETKDTSITEAVVPSTYKDKPVKEISGAFFGCENLVRVTIPEGIWRICNSAFGNCKSLKNINIPSSVTEIGYEAFQGCESLESININSGVTKIDLWAFSYCKSLKSVTIGAEVTEIENYAFTNCDSLSGITFVNTSNWVNADNKKSVPNSNSAVASIARLAAAFYVKHKNCIFHIKKHIDSLFVSPKQTRKYQKAAPHTFPYKRSSLLY